MQIQETIFYTEQEHYDSRPLVILIVITIIFIRQKTIWNIHSHVLYIIKTIDLILFLRQAVGYKYIKNIPVSSQNIILSSLWFYSKKERKKIRTKKKLLREHKTFYRERTRIRDWEKGIEK